MPIPGGMGVGLGPKPGTPSIYSELSRELAGGKPLSYIGMSGQIQSTGGISPSGGGGVSAPAPVTAPAPAPATAPVAGALAGGETDFMSLYRQAIEGLKGGGRALESQLADIEAGKQQAIARGQQSLVSGGLAGTTMMAGVPLQAERGAGRARLAARGGAEQLYFQTLASYASFAQQAQQARLEREAAMQRLQTTITGQQTGARASETAAMQRLQTQLGTQERLATRTGGSRAPYIPLSKRTQEAYTYGASLTPDIKRGPIGSGYYANQFPSIYGQGGAEQPVPQWMS